MESWKICGELEVEDQRFEIWETKSSCDLRAGFYELQEGIDGRFGVIVVVIEFLEKQHLSSG